MTQRSVAKTYVHLKNEKHVQVPLYQSRGLAAGEFSIPLFTSRSFFGERKYATYTVYGKYPGYSLVGSEPWVAGTAD
jgi:hypothetical protein